MTTCIRTRIRSCLTSIGKALWLVLFMANWSLVPLLASDNSVVFKDDVDSDLDEAVAWDTYSDTWVATDGLGRSVPGADEVGPPKEGRHVAMFYFLWMTGKGPVYDLNRMLAADPENPEYGPSPAFHFWAEPLFGYYRSDDEAVIRKHLQMLADAGVDVLCFDVTNALTYDDTYLAVCRVLEDMRRGGHRVPRIAFLANSHHERVVPRLYQDFYARNLHADLWFRWKGRPLLLTPLNGLDATVTNFFTLRQSWAWSHPGGWFGDGRDKWPWLDHTPQQFGWHESPDRPEQIPVAVAQHPTTNIGRSFQNGRQPPPDRTRSEVGHYFAEQWARALEVDPELVFVTGWNEWIAQRFLSDGKQSFMGRTLPAGETFFVDAYNQEFSRDIEPMRGGYGDHYQYQLASYIRRYKGARTLPPLSGGPVTVDGRFDDWTSVGPEFRDTQGDPVQRDHPGWEGQPRFVNRTGRNDIVAAKVAANDTHVFFYVRTREPLTPATDPHWMHLFINADQNSDTGWLGYDYIVNRSGVRPNRTTLERNLGGRYQWGDPVDLDYRLTGNELELAIPRAALGLGQGSFTLDFKWADNCYQNGDWTDFTLNGDAAPNDRFNYRAMYQAAEESGDAVPQKPNVIFILADDQRHDELGCTGHPLIKTPNIDRLAQEGKLFVNSFTPSASCLPNRTSLLTGQWERRHTVGWNSRSGLSPEQWSNTLPMVLQRNGYVTAYVGKNHTPGLRPWDFDFYYGNRIGHLGFYPKKAYPIFNNASADTQPEILGEGASCFLQNEASFVDRAGSQATVFLRERDQDKPFFLYVCLNVPHSNGTRSMEQRETDDPLYRSDYRDLESQMPLPAGYIAEADVKTPKLPANIYSGKQIPTYDYRRTPETLREQRVRVCQTVTGIDRIVGQLVAQLQRLGQADNTIIVYSSDNGILHGEHGYGGKCLLYEPSIRVPLIIYDPRIPVPQRGERVSELVVSPDVPSTILDLCGVTVPESMQGTSLRPLLQGESVSWRKDIFCERLILLQDYPLAQSVRSQDWKYIRYWPNRAEPADYREVLNLGLNGETPEYEELFHLAVDPSEQTNLAGDPQHQNQLAAMRARCTELLRATRGAAGQLPTITDNEWNKEAPADWRDVLRLMSREGAAKGE
jgi:arylsulfatase A-like enzyme